MKEAPESLSSLEVQHWQVPLEVWTYILRFHVEWFLTTTAAQAFWHMQSQRWTVLVVVKDGNG
jgi:hypothetical protein